MITKNGYLRLPFRRQRVGSSSSPSITAQWTSTLASMTSMTSHTTYFYQNARSLSNSAKRSSSTFLLHTEHLSANQGSTSSDDGDGRSSKPYSSIVFLHGLLGNGRNLKTFARNVVKKKASQPQYEQRPVHQSSLGGILVDLPGHGKSRLTVDQKNGTPYSFARCVDDIHSTMLAQTQKASPSSMPQILVGHSWGGRLALEYTARQASVQEEEQTMDSCWLIDTVPGVANDSVNRVIDAVSEIVQASTVLDKNQLIEVLVDKYKIDTATAQWLASSYNLPDDQRSTIDFGFDLHLVRDIQSEFGTQDFMGLLFEILDRSPTAVHLVRGGRNTAWTVPILNDLGKLQKDFPTKFGLHTLPKAGHWVHIDDQTGLVNLF